MPNAEQFGDSVIVACPGRTCLKVRSQKGQSCSTLRLSMTAGPLVPPPPPPDLLRAEGPPQLSPSRCALIVSEIRVVTQRHDRASDTVLAGKGMQEAWGDAQGAQGMRTHENT